MNAIVKQPSKTDHPNDLLHGITLEMIVKDLVEQLGWEEMGRAVSIRCFTNNPNINSSLKFLRRTPWARIKVEELYLWLKMQSNDQ